VEQWPERCSNGGQNLNIQEPPQKTNVFTVSHTISDELVTPTVYRTFLTNGYTINAVEILLIINNNNKTTAYKAQ